MGMDRNSPEFLARLARYKGWVTDQAMSFTEPESFLPNLEKELSDERTYVRQGRLGVKVLINQHVYLHITKTGVSIQEHKADNSGEVRKLEKITPEIASKAYEMVMKKLLRINDNTQTNPQINKDFIDKLGDRD